MNQKDPARSSDAASKRTTRSFGPQGSQPSSAAKRSNPKRSGPVERKAQRPDAPRQPAKAGGQNRKPKAKPAGQAAPNQNKPRQAAPGRKPQDSHPATQRSGNPREGSRRRRNPRRERRIRAPETVEDIRKDIDRIEKEIWIEIAEIHTISLDA